MKKFKVTPFVRFLQKIRKTKTCWFWKARTWGGGYGVFDEGYAHRWAYKYFVGPIPKNFQVHHKCDNPSCVNPKHLWVGTQQDNMNDMNRKHRAVHASGILHHWYGKRHSKSSKQKVAAAKKKFWRNLSLLKQNKIRRNMSAAMKLVWKRKKGN